MPTFSIKNLCSPRILIFERLWIVINRINLNYGLCWWYRMYLPFIGIVWLPQVNFRWLNLMIMFISSKRWLSLNDVIICGWWLRKDIISYLMSQQEINQLIHICGLIGIDHQYSVVVYLVLSFRLRIDHQSFIEMDMRTMR